MTRPPEPAGVPVVPNTRHGEAGVEAPPDPPVPPSQVARQPVGGEPLIHPVRFA